MQEEHDRNLMQTLIDRVHLFGNGRISLAVLIADIEFLLTQFESVNNSIINEIKYSWEILEETHSAIISNGAAEDDPETRKIMDEAINRIMDSAHDYLQTHPN